MKYTGFKTSFALASTLVGSLLLIGAAQAQQSPPLQVCVGYADNFRPVPQYPNPWQGSPGVLFEGKDASGIFDAGAIHFENTGTTNLKITDLLVDGFHDGSSFHIWNSLIGSGITLLPGQMAIFTQTNGENFDTSDTPNLNTTHNPDQPKIHLTLDTYGTVIYTDSKQILNTGGFDLATLDTNNKHNESLGWRPIGTTGIEDVDGHLGGDCQLQVVPEPGSLALLVTGGLPLLGFLRRRKRA